jgi:phosphopantetheinyl transferase
MSAYLTRRAPVPQKRLPFITDVIDLVPGFEATARYQLSTDRDLLFLDHTLGRDVSDDDPELRGQPVVPITVAMEILAEGGSLLAPGKVLSGVRDFRAYRCITVDPPGISLEIRAEQREHGAVYVTLRESGPAGAVRPLLAEGLMLFADAYPPAPPAEPAVAGAASAWSAGRLYRDGWFHGPSFRAVRSFDVISRSGVSATLEVLPRSALFQGDPQPGFLLDPVLLDGAWQVVAFWAREQLDPTGDIFPYRLAALSSHAPLLPEGTRVECRLRVRHVGDKEIHSDIDLVGSGGAVLYHLESWEGRRFSHTPEFWRLRIDPREAFLSTVWDQPVAAFSNHDRVICCRLDAFPHEFVEGSDGIWLKVLAGIILSRSEREHWNSMRAVLKRRLEWLLGRCAAKDAVRVLVRKHLGTALAPADIEIVPDAHGKPRVEGAWTTRLGIEPGVSISHSAGTAVALAALDGHQAIGIDVETVSARIETVESVVFSPDERELLAGLPQDLRQEWALRMWCAKEAVSKALGRGIAAGLDSFRVTGAEVNTGILQMRVEGMLTSEFPQLRGKTMIAYTARENDLVFSSIVYRKGTVQ